jgi:two-component system, chemotaxis family, response regulator Rcp1
VSAQASSVKPLRVLLVEDNPADARLVLETFKEGHFLVDLKVVRDGIQALHILREASPQDLPDLMLLDLNLPRKNGFEVLAEIKNMETLRSIPIIIMTTSDAPKDIVRSYELHANAFITKPVALEEFIETIRKVEEFWLTVVRYPTRSTHE